MWVQMSWHREALFSLAKKDSQFTKSAHRKKHIPGLIDVVCSLDPTISA